MRTLLAAFVLLLATSPAALGEAKTLSDRWYVVSMAGQRVGYIHIHQSQKPNQEIITRETMTMKIKRGQTVVETRLEGTTREHAGNKLFCSEQATMSGASKIVEQFAVGKNGRIEFTVSQNGQIKTSHVEAGDVTLLAPEQARRLFVDQLGKGKKSFTYHTISLSSGRRPVKITAQIKGRENVEVFGRVVPAILTERQNSAYPTLGVKEYVDEQGRMVKAVTDMGGGLSFKMTLADREIALAKIDPPEMLASSMIEPDKRIRGPRRIRKASYVLRVKAEPKNPDSKPDKKPASNAKPDRFPVALPTAGCQHVTRQADGSVRVDVNLDKLVDVKDDHPTKWHRAASSICDSEDKKIIELVKDALKGLDDDTKDSLKADRLRAYVQRYVRSKDLSVGFGHASEVARTRQGDCTEHAVLLAAMLRAAGIPSRGVTGLVYADQFAGQKRVFVYHMWTQAWVEDKKGEGYWMDVDATLPKRAFDAAHIALGNSVLNESADNGAGNDMIKFLPLFGRLEVNVLEAK